MNGMVVANYATPALTHPGIASETSQLAVTMISDDFHQYDNIMASETSQFSMMDISECFHQDLSF